MGAAWGGKGDRALPAGHGASWPSTYVSCTAAALCAPGLAGKWSFLCLPNAGAVKKWPGPWWAQKGAADQRH